MPVKRYRFVSNVTPNSHDFQPITGEVEYTIYPIIICICGELDHERLMVKYITLHFSMFVTIYTNDKSSQSDLNEIESYRVKRVIFVIYCSYIGRPI